VQDATFKGVHYVMRVKSNNDGFVWHVKSTQLWTAGSEVGVVIIPNAIHIMKKYLKEDDLAAKPAAEAAKLATAAAKPAAEKEAKP
jgi:hypothetical protein